MKQEKIYVTLLLILFGLGACKKVDELTQFNMDYNEIVIVPASSGISLPFNILTPEMESNAESTFAINDTRKDLIEEILLTKLDLVVKTPDGEDFSFLKSIDVFLNADGLSEIKVAWNNDVPDSPGSALKLETTENNLMEYIKKDEFSLRLNTVTDETFATDYHIEVISSFFVDAKVLGQ
jgi:hypothetical protein